LHTNRGTTACTPTGAQLAHQQGHDSLHTNRGTLAHQQGHDSLHTNRGTACTPTGARQLAHQQGHGAPWRPLSWSMPRNGHREWHVRMVVHTRVVIRGGALHGASSRVVHVIRPVVTFELCQGTTARQGNPHKHTSICETQRGGERGKGKGADFARHNARQVSAWRQGRPSSNGVGLKVVVTRLAWRQRGRTRPTQSMPRPPSCTAGCLRSCGKHST
jgi:hypothetical protein